MKNTLEIFGLGPVPKLPNPGPKIAKYEKKSYFAHNPPKIAKLSPGTASKITAIFFCFTQYQRHLIQSQPSKVMTKTLFHQATMGFNTACQPLNVRALSSKFPS